MKVWMKDGPTERALMTKFTDKEEHKFIGL